jgi:flagellar FliL protein
VDKTMSEETPAAEAPAAAAPAKAPSSSKLVPLLLVVNLAASGAGIFFQLKNKPVAVAPAGEGAGGEKGKDEAHGPGPTATLEPFVVNLNETGSSRYLKATFELELADAKAAEALEKDKRGVRDEILRYLSGLGVADTLGSDNKDKIRTELVARVDKELGGGKVKKVFFTDFVVQ